MKPNKIFLILIITSLILFIGGRLLGKIYGFDRPYAYFWIGTFMQLISLILALSAFVLLLINLIRKQKSCKNDL